jgi:hypothetical protein
VGAESTKSGIGQDDQPLGERLKLRASDPTVLVGLPLAAFLCLFRFVGLIAPVPYLLIVLLVFGAEAISVFAAAAWGYRPGGWQLTAYVGAVMGVIGIIAYSTGWGPILSLGFIFGAASAFEVVGSRATVPALMWAVIYMGLGQFAIREGFAPSLIRQPWSLDSLLCASSVC